MISKKLIKKINKNPNMFGLNVQILRILLKTENIFNKYINPFYLRNVRV